MNPRDRFQRTTCACAGCSAHCKRMPGYLLPGDLERIIEHVQPDDPEQFANDNFLASSKTKVLIRGKVAHVPTIVPAVNENGCVFLSEDGQCTIHAVSPYGCAYFDDHLQQGPTLARMDAGLKYLIGDIMQLDESEYLKRWMTLEQLGKVKVYA